MKPSRIKVTVKVMLEVDADEWTLNYGTPRAMVREDVRAAAADALLYLGSGSVKMVQRKDVGGPS